MNELATITSPRWNPFQEVEEIQNRLQSFLSRTTNGNGLASLFSEGTEFADWRPAADVTEDDNEYVIAVDLPDVKKEDIKVSQENGRLTIRGERHREAEEKTKKWHRVERSHGKYIRSFELPEEIEVKKIDAAFKNGVLTIHLPKLAEKKIKRSGIEIEVK